MLRGSLAGLLFISVIACSAQTGGGSSSGGPDSAPAAVVGPSTSAPPPPTKITYSQCHVDGPYIAITFDDGPHGQNTPRLLDILQKRNVKATFFVVGQCAAEFPAIMKRIVTDGHEIANHSWSHPLLTKLGESGVSEQLQRTHDVIIETTGVVPKLMRPPFGGFTPNQRAWANRKWSYKVILWDVDPLDWKVRNAERVEAEILKRTVPGSIVLAHDIHKSTIDAMPSTLDALLAKGFRFVTVSELLAMDRPAAPKAKATPTAPASTAPTTAPETAPRPAEPAVPPSPAVPPATAR